MQKSKLALTGSILALAGTLLLPLQAHATENGITPSATLRMAAEAVRPDNTAAMGNYGSVRDAYSSFGLDGHYNINGSTAVFAQINVPFDSANLSTHDPFDQEEGLNTAYVGVSSDYGTLMLGQQWMPYYNAVAVQVDMFSSYYTGFATYSVFRLRDTVGYVSPTWDGLTLSASYSAADGNKRSLSRIDDRRIQAAATYTTGDTTFAVGYDDHGADGWTNDENIKLYGASVGHTMGDFYFGAKYEYISSGITDGTYATDGDQAVNLFGSYTFGKNTAKLMWANVDGYGENVVHVGLDHQLTKKLKLFAEFYYEEETAAITAKKGGMGDSPSGVDGGKVFLVGFHYNFL